MKAFSSVLFTKALFKQKVPNYCRDARFLNPLFEFELAACCKKEIKKASQQMFGPSYFVRALVQVRAW